MSKRILAAAIMLILLLSGCAKKESASPATATKPAENGSYSSQSKSESSAAAPTESDQNNAIQNKKIIQNYEISILTDDIMKASSEISNKVKELDGYIESEEIMEYGGNSSIRIPSSSIDKFIYYIDKNYEINSKNKFIEDVTESYVDNDARIKNLAAEEVQVLEILKKANTVDEILKVQNELYRIRGEIEVLQSRKKMWDRQVDYSTVRLNISKKQIVSDKKIKILSGSEFFKSIGQGFKNTFLYVVLTFQKIIILLVSALIPLVIIAGIAYGVYKLSKKMKK
jgi:major membrane immunogen (membrane-anchored lipoprotein)